MDFFAKNEIQIESRKEQQQNIPRFQTQDIDLYGGRIKGKQPD
jgi:hypothetical protein